MPRIWPTLIPLLLVVGACSDDHPSAKGSTSTPTVLVATTTTLPAGAPDPNSLFPDTPIVSGQNATVNGAFSSVALATPQEDGTTSCEYVTRSDGKKVYVLFPDVYQNDKGLGLPGPPDYQGDARLRDHDANLAHPGDKVIVAGEVDETDSTCAKSSDYPGLVINTSVWSKA
jgi:hypothetical protein